MRFFITLLLSVLITSVFSQQTDLISNSFENDYHKSNPALAYSYNNISQIHNYSNNWDFDNDGIKDQLYFVGTGGAHLYYFLKVVLSSNNQPHEFNFIESDFPMLTATDTLNFHKTPIGFVVANLGKSLNPSIIVRLDESSYSINKKLFAKKGIKTKNIVVSFEHEKAKYSCL